MSTLTLALPCCGKKGQDSHLFVFFCFPAPRFSHSPKKLCFLHPTSFCTSLQFPYPLTLPLALSLSLTPSPKSRFARPHLATTTTRPPSSYRYQLALNLRNSLQKQLAANFFLHTTPQLITSTNQIRPSCLSSLFSASRLSTTPPCSPTSTSSRLPLSASSRLRRVCLRSRREPVHASSTSP